MPKGKRLDIFIRFGGLNIKKQNGYGNNTFHSPPTTHGIYAMPLVAQEYFLISSINRYQPGTFPSEKNMKKLANNYKEHFAIRKKGLALKRKKFYKNNGNVWHHLIEYVDKKEILSMHGSWVKTSIKAWQKAFSKMSINLRYGNKDFKISSINQTRGIIGFYTKDHCEVFFDEKV